MTVIARYSSICPCCDRYIAKGKSKIVRLPEPRTISAEFLRWDPHPPHRGWWHTGHMIRLHNRDKLYAWAHERCAASAGKVADG